MSGTPAHEPTEKSRKQVETMAGYGIPSDDIAAAIGVSAPTLRKYYRAELDVGHVKANTAVVQSLYKKALGDGPAAVTAAIFWLKCRCKWSDRVEAINGDVPQSVEVRIIDGRKPDTPAS